MENIALLGEDIHRAIQEMYGKNLDTFAVLQIFEALNGRISMLAIELQKCDGKV